MFWLISLWKTGKKKPQWRLDEQKNTESGNQATVKKKKKNKKLHILWKESQRTEKSQDSAGILSQYQKCISHKLFKLFKIYIFL